MVRITMTMCVGIVGEEKCGCVFGCGIKEWICEFSFGVCE